MICSIKGIQFEYNFKLSCYNLIKTYEKRYGIDALLLVV